MRYMAGCGPRRILISSFILMMWESSKSFCENWDIESAGIHGHSPPPVSRFTGCGAPNRIARSC